jgi:hypothetical protein
MTFSMGTELTICDWILLKSIVLEISFATFNSQDSENFVHFGGLGSVRLDEVLGYMSLA